MYPQVALKAQERSYMAVFPLLHALERKPSILLFLKVPATIGG